MHIYKFRMLWGENDNFVRDIEIQASQTFLDFHEAIANCVSLDRNDLASFHICDQKWNKNQEITLVDMMEDAEEDKDKEEEQESRIAKPVIMNNAKIAKYINEPHQRLIYEFDFLNMKTFFVELLSVFKQKNDDEYPKCTLKRGDINEQVLPEDFEGTDEDLKNELLEDFDDLLGDRLEEIGGEDL